MELSYHIFLEFATTKYNFSIFFDIELYQPYHI